MESIRENLKRAISVFISGSLLVGCATRSEHIKPTYVSSVQYDSLDCEAIEEELSTVKGRLMEISGIQNETANKDAAVTGVGVVLFWPALFLIAAGEDNKEQVAQLKGTYDALIEAASNKECSYAQGLIEARESEGYPTAPAGTGTAQAEAAEEDLYEKVPERNVDPDTRGGEEGQDYF